MIYLTSIVFYLLVLVAVGIYKVNSVKNSEDFMVAGRTLPWFILVGTLLATWMGSGSLFSGAGLGFHRYSTVIIFDFEVAVFALLFLSIGDAVAALVGRALPIGKIWNKSILGSLSGCLLCVFFGLAINNTLPSQIIVLGAISGMLIELIPLKINDNFSIPIFSGLIMQILKEIL